MQAMTPYLTAGRALVALAIALGGCGPGDPTVADGGVVDAEVLADGGGRNDGGAVADAATECAEGSWLQERCTPWTVCGPGRYVVAEGDARTDRSCADCPAGTFSEADDAASCAPWTECGDGLHGIWPGSATQDRRCAEPAWARQLGTERLDAIWAVDVTASGVVTSGTADDELFVRALGEDGADLWSHRVLAGASVYDAVSAVGADPDGSVYVAGAVSEALPGQRFAGGNQDAFVRKLNAAGDEVWTRQFGTPGDEDVLALTLDRAGRIVLVGQTSGSLGGPHLGNRDAFVRVYSPDGAVVWTRQLGSPENDLPRGVVASSTAGLYVVGSTSGALPGATSLGLADGFIASYAMDGTELWVRQLGTAGSDEIVDVAEGSAGIALTGATTGAWPGATARGHRDVFVAVMDETAEEIVWLEQFGTGEDEYATALTADAAGNLTVGGTISGALPGFTHGGGLDGFARSYTASGAERWTIQLGFGGIDQVTSLAATPEGSVYLVGAVTGALPGQTHLGSWDAFVARLTD